MSKTTIWDAAIPIAMIQNKGRPETALEAGKEALFLLVMATGIRVDDAWKLGVNLKFNGESLILPYREARKAKINGAISTEQWVRPYPIKRVCPVAAIEFFVKLSSKDRRGGELFLFISPSTGKRAFLYTLRRWNSDILTEAGIDASPGSCRSAATSRAYADGVHTRCITASAGWSHEDMFFKHYRREVSARVHQASAVVNLMPSLPH